ncbi:MAG: hypothetical protein U0103_07620 [Candidatus Obscuribacterales bacterium]
MVTKSAPIIALLALTALALPPAWSSDTREEVIEALRATELPSGPTDDLTDEKLSEVALKSKTVEAKRDTYARALELYMERIGAGKDVDQALIDYERAEIALAAEWKTTRKVLEVIKKQDKLAHEWKHYRTLHPEHSVNHHHNGHSGDQNSTQNADHNSVKNTEHESVKNADHHSYNTTDHQEKPQAHSGSGDIFF